MASVKYTEKEAAILYACWKKHKISGSKELADLWYQVARNDYRGIGKADHQNIRMYFASAALLCYAKDYAHADIAINKAVDEVLHGPAPITEFIAETEPDADAEPEPEALKNRYQYTEKWVEKGSQISYGDGLAEVIQLVGSYRGSQLDSVRKRFNIPENVKKAWVWIVAPC